MVKKWELKIRKRKKEKPVSITESELRSPNTRVFPLRPPPYKHPEIIYNNSRRPRWVRTQHRMISEGRAIALGQHPRRFFKSYDEDLQIWTFESIIVKRGFNIESKEYRVFWNGVDDPIIVMSFGDGNAYALPEEDLTGNFEPAAVILSVDSTIGQYVPDAFVWAAWMLTHPVDIPPDEYWPPYGDIYPQWNELNVGPYFPTSSPSS